MSTPEFAATQSVAAGGGTPNSPTAAQFTADAAARGSFTPDTSASAGNTLAQGSIETHASAQTAAPGDTLLGAESRTQTAPKPSPLPAMLIGGVVLLAGAGTAAWFALRPTEDTAGAPASAEPFTATSADLPPTEPAASVASNPPAPSASQATAEVVPTSAVRLDVETEPPGAVLLKDGFQVCDSTPCEVTANVNETLEFEARRGPLRGKAKVLAQKDQRVKISLAGAAAAPPKKPPATRLCERFDPNLGIKIMAPCE